MFSINEVRHLAEADPESAGVQQCFKYLADRGISPAEARSVGVAYLPAEALIRAAGHTGALGGLAAALGVRDTRWAVVFPHRSYVGEEIEWWSSRLVATPAQPGLKLVTPSFCTQFGFKDTSDPANWGKMYCPPNSAPHAYLVPCTAVLDSPDWNQLARGDRVYIHESVIKALNGGKLSKYSVGLNGVWGWSAKKHGVEIVPELADIPWKALELQPVIVFDSDYTENDKVRLAAARLNERLQGVCKARESVVLVVPPGADGSKRGFDDFCVQVGATAARLWLEQSEGVKPETDELRMELMRMNEEVAIVSSLSRIVDLGTGTVMTRGDFCGVQYAARRVWNAEEEKWIPVAEMWLKDEKATRVSALAYAPGQGAITQAGEANMWRGMGLAPRMGDVSPWLNLLKNNVPDEDTRKWILQWLAYPLQVPGAKLLNYLIVYGPSGTGKGRFFAPMMRIYGENAVVISKENISSTFNSTYAQRQWIQLDELQRHRASGDQDDVISQKVKFLASNEKIIVNRKGVPEYEVRNAANLVITSNYYDCIKLDADDRRAAVIKWEPVSKAVDFRMDEEYWVQFSGWIDAGGAEHIYDYLLSVDLSDFNPNGWAPDSLEKQEIVEESKAPMLRWVEDMMENPETIIPLINKGRALFTAKEIAQWYFKSAEELPHGQILSMSRALKQAGVQQADHGKKLRVGGGRIDRFWVVDTTLTGQDWGSYHVCVRHLARFM
jgi:hypothetical protein